MSEFSLRAALTEDVQTLYDWRNHPTTRAVSGSTEPIEFAAHAEWFYQLLAEERRFLWFGCINQQAVGTVRLDETEGSSGIYTISIQVDPDRRGQGFGSKILIAACARARQELAGCQLLALIRPTNRPSRRLFCHAGFSRQRVLTPAGLEVWHKDCQQVAII